MICVSIIEQRLCRCFLKAGPSINGIQKGKKGTKYLELCYVVLSHPVYLIRLDFSYATPAKLFFLELD